MANLVQNFLTSWKIGRWRWAFPIAVASDALGFGVALLPPVQWLIDALTAAALLIALGFRWQLLIALAMSATTMRSTSDSKKALP